MDHPGDRRGNTLVLSNDIGKLGQHLLLDLWRNGNPEGALACIKAMSFTFDPSDPQQSREWEGEFDAYPWDSNKLFKTVTQPFTHSRTLMGMAGSELIMNIMNPAFNIGDYSLKIGRSGVSGETDGERLLGEISASEGGCRFWPSRIYDFTYQPIAEGAECCKVRLLNKTGGGSSEVSLRWLSQVLP